MDPAEQLFRVKCTMIGYDCHINEEGAIIVYSPQGFAGGMLRTQPLPFYQICGNTSSWTEALRRLDAIIIKYGSR